MANQHRFTIFKQRYDRVEAQIRALEPQLESRINLRNMANIGDEAQAMNIIIDGLQTVFGQTITLELMALHCDDPLTARAYRRKARELRQNLETLINRIKQNC